MPGNWGAVVDGGWPDDAGAKVAGVPLEPMAARSDHPPVVPPDAAVRRVLSALGARGIEAAIGGSGLLAALGLVDRVNDWDVTTDAPAEIVRAALDDTGLVYRAATVRDGTYATRERFVVATDDHEIDVIVGFAAIVDGRVVAFPTRVTGEWRGLPLADPAVWADAYRHIGRSERADLLRRWLHDRTP